MLEATGGQPEGSSVLKRPSKTKRGVATFLSSSIYVLFKKMCCQALFNQRPFKFPFFLQYKTLDYIHPSYLYADADEEIQRSENKIFLNIPPARHFVSFFYLFSNSAVCGADNL